MAQLDMFIVDEIDFKISNFKSLLKDVPWDLVAVNKLYQSAVIFDREDKCLYYADCYKGYFVKDYRAPGMGNAFGPNYLLLDQRFSAYESVELTNSKRQYTTCPRYELDGYLAVGWQVERNA